jgi:site-specific DNA-cytosine methylase
MKIGSLFSGIGGLELGLEWAGVGRTAWQVEQDLFCQAVLAHHWPDAKRYNDVREVGAHNLEPVDVICGGFPCQDISYAGKGAGLAGARSGLWYEFARIIGELGPQYVVVENVAALFTRGIDAVLGTLAEAGYERFDLDDNADRRAWRARQEWLGMAAADQDGIPGRKSVAFLKARGFSHGLWVLPPAERLDTIT